MADFENENKIVLIRIMSSGIDDMSCCSFVNIIDKLKYMSMI